MFIRAIVTTEGGRVAGETNRADHQPLRAARPGGVPGKHWRDPVTGDAYVGSLTDGTLYRLGAAGQAEVWSGAG